MAERLNFKANAFAGAAEDYRLYRPPYPRAMLDEIADRAGGTPRRRLLDLACGPGRIALPLASRFDEVWALDLEPDMIAVGRAEAAREGVANVTWLTGRAEDLEAPSAAFDLITIGEAFHRLDQPRIGALSLGWLKPGGCLAAPGAGGPLSGAQPWQGIVRDVAWAWTKDAFPDGWAPPPEERSDAATPEAAALREAGFADVATYSFTEDHVWTVESIAGYLRSTSVCSINVLGDARPGFEAALREALLAHDASGVYPEQLSFGYTIGRKP